MHYHYHLTAPLIARSETLQRQVQQFEEILKEEGAEQLRHAPRYYYLKGNVITAGIELQRQGSVTYVDIYAKRDQFKKLPENIKEYLRANGAYQHRHERTTS